MVVFGEEKSFHFVWASALRAPSLKSDSYCNADSWVSGTGASSLIRGEFGRHLTVEERKGACFGKRPLQLLAYPFLLTHYTTRRGFGVGTGAGWVSSSSKPRGL